MKIPKAAGEFRPDDGPCDFTIRDHFASLALSVIIATRPHETAEKKALESYQIADSMMRQRDRMTNGL